MGAVAMREARPQILAFAGDERPRRCRHKHQLQGTGAVFYQSVGLLQCSRCGGWQKIKKPIE